jgi:hypothetical protein
MQPHADDTAEAADMDHVEAAAGDVMPGNPAVAPWPRITEPADIEAWRARKEYPSTLVAGGPVFGVARERAEGGWELLPYFAGQTPQDARDELGAHLRTLAREALRAGRDAGAREYTAAAGRLDEEAVDELTVRGRRYRVVRAERFIRMGPDGPEPPRATDPDPGGPGDPAAATDPAAGLVVAAGTDASAVVTAELLAAMGRDGRVPDQVAEDARRAAHTHPGGVLLPATFMTAERKGGTWQPVSAGIAPTPQAARDGLATHLRVVVPWQKELTAGEREVYRLAADRLDAERRDELDVAGRHFRIVRVERLLRTGPDGPEGPRPRDLAQDFSPRAAVPEETEPPLPDDRVRRFLELFEEERLRRGGH